MAPILHYVMQQEEYDEEDFDFWNTISGMLPSGRCTDGEHAEPDSADFNATDIPSGSNRSDAIQSVDPL
jgi:hypothetical protein